jgi:hypothetical protein
MDIQVPSLTVKLTFLASGRGLLMSSAGSNFFFAAVCAETETVRHSVAMSILFKACSSEAGHYPHLGGFRRNCP